MTSDPHTPMDRESHLRALVNKWRASPTPLPPSAPRTCPQSPRHRRYVDFALQMRLLVILIAMEILLVVGGLYYLHHRFSDIFARNLYRIHTPPAEETLRLLLSEAGVVVLIMVMANLFALILADRLWVNIVNRVLARFRALATRIKDLDLSEAGEEIPNHESVERIQEWRRHERRRSLAIKGFLGGIQPHADWNNPEEQAFLQRQLRRLRRVLPPYSRRFVGKMDEPLSSSPQYPDPVDRPTRD